MSRDPHSRDEYGDYGEKYTNSSILSAVRRLEPTTTGEVADELDCHRNTARDRLKKLEKNGSVSKEKIGQEFVWRTI